MNYSGAANDLPRPRAHAAAAIKASTADAGPDSEQSNIYMKPLLAINHKDEYQDLQHEEERLKKHVAPLVSMEITVKQFHN